MAAPTPLRTAVIGVGYLGKFHAQKYARLPDARLVAVVDADRETARRIAEENQCEALTDAKALIGRVDAVSIVVPTQLHAEVALPLIEAGIHCLVEKPFAATVAQAEVMLEAARRKGIVLQVGHLERFNPIWTAGTDHLKRPVFIEAHRLAGFKERGLDVDVIMDLMIHDLDLVLALLPGRAVTSLHAVGVAVLSANIDIANARLTFEGGAVANLTASRVSMEPVRKFRVFQPDAYLSMDFNAKKADLIQMETGADGKKSLGGQRIEGEAQDALEAEIADFLQAVRGGQRSGAGPEEGLAALRLAHRIVDDIRSNRELQQIVESRGG